VFTSIPCVLYLGSAILQYGSVLAPVSPTGHYQYSCEGGTHYSPTGGCANPAEWSWVPYLFSVHCKRSCDILCILHIECFKTLHHVFFRLPFLWRSLLWQPQPPAYGLCSWRWRWQKGAGPRVTCSGMTETVSTPLKCKIIATLSSLPDRWERDERCLHLDRCWGHVLHLAVLLLHSKVTTHWQFFLYIFIYT